LSASAAAEEEDPTYKAQRKDTQNTMINIS
jgi:hypothetical protein